MQPGVEKATDKYFLQSIVENNCRLPDDINIFEFSKALLSNYYSTDAQLRDELSNSILFSLIVEQEKLTPVQLEDLLLICIDENHLLYRLGEAGTDSVFMRSFSALAVAAILIIDAKIVSLSESITRQAEEAVLRLAKEEKDWRGYVEEKGWAHAVAHVSDVLDEITQNRYMSQRDCEDVMMVVSHLAQVPAPLFYEEDERLALTALRVIEQAKVEDGFLLRWLESFHIEELKWDLASYSSRINAKNFLRSLSFHLQRKKVGLQFIEPISRYLEQLTPLDTDSHDA